MFNPLKKFQNWTGSFISKVLRYALNKSFGEYLKNDVEREKLNLQAWDGILKIEEVNLDETVLNRKLNKTVPFRILSARVKSIKTDIPWRNFEKEQANLLIKGAVFYISFQTNYSDLDSSMMSCVSTMSNSRAEEEDDEKKDDGPNFIEEEASISQTVQSVIERIFKGMTIYFEDTQVVIENDEHESMSIKIGKIFFAGLDHLFNEQFKKQAKIEDIQVDVQTLSPSLEPICQTILAQKETNYLFFQYDKNEEGNLTNVTIEGSFKNGCTQLNISPSFLQTVFKLFFPKPIPVPETSLSSSSRSLDLSQSSQNSSNKASYPAFSLIEPKNWTPTEVNQWLEFHKFKLNQNFSINGEELLTLKFEDLSQYGIESSDQQAQLFNLIQTLNEKKEDSASSIEDGKMKSNLATIFKLFFNRIELNIISSSSVITLNLFDLKFESNLNYFIFGMEAFQLKENQSKKTLLKLNKSTSNSPNFQVLIKKTPKQGEELFTHFDLTMGRIHLFYNPLTINRVIEVLNLLTFISDTPLQKVESETEPPPQSLKIKIPLFKFQIEFPNSELKVSGEVSETKIVKQLNTTYIEFQKLRTFLNIKHNNNAFPFFTVYTEDELDYPRINITSMNPYKLNNTQPIFVINNLEKTFQDSMIKYYPKAWTKLFPIEDDQINLTRVNQIVESIIEIVFPCFTLEIEKSNIIHLLKLQNLFLGSSSTTSSSLIFFFNSGKIRLYDTDLNWKKSIQNNSDKAPSFSVSIQGMKGFYGSIESYLYEQKFHRLSKQEELSKFIKIDLASFFLLDFSSFEVKDSIQDPLFQKTPSQLKLLQYSSSPFFLNLSKIQIWISNSFITVTRALFWLKPSSIKELLQFLPSMPVQVKEEKNISPLEVVIENISFVYQGKVKYSEKASITPACVIFYFHFIKIKRKSETEFFINSNQFLTFLKENFHVKRNKLIGIDFCYPNLSTFLIGGPGFICISNLSKFEISIHLLSTRTKIFLNFLSNKNVSLIIGPQSDSFQSILDVSKHMLEDLNSLQLESLFENTSSSNEENKNSSKEESEEDNEEKNSASQNHFYVPIVSLHSSHLDENDNSLLFNEFDQKDAPNKTIEEEWIVIPNYTERRAIIETEERSIFSKYRTKILLELNNLQIFFKLLGGSSWDILNEDQKTKNVAISSSSDKVIFRMVFSTIQFSLFSPGELAHWRILFDGLLEIEDQISKSKLRFFLNPKINKLDDDIQSIRFVLEKGIYNPSIQTPSFKFRLLLPTLRFTIDEDTLRFIVDFFSFHKKEEPDVVSINSSSSEGYLFEYFELSPISSVVDYKPKGNLDEIIAQFRSGSSLWIIRNIRLQECQLSLSKIKLEKIQTRDKLFEEIGNVWFCDFKSNQLYNYFFGTRIGHSVSFALNIGGGVVDLVKTPISEYQRGGNVLKGIGEGTTSFAQKLTLQLVSLGVSGSSTLQKGLQNLNNAITPSEDKTKTQPSVSLHVNQPKNISEGFTQAIYEVYNHTYGGFSNIVNGGIRYIPSVITEPVIGTLGGFSKIFLGIRNTIEPNLRKDESQKYKQDNSNDEEYDSSSLSSSTLSKKETDE